MQTPTHAGWFDDPENDQQLRYFDGVVWTKHTTPRSTRQASSAPAQPGQQQYPGQGHPPQYPGQTQSASSQGSQGSTGGQGQAPSGDAPQGRTPAQQGQQQGGWQAPNPQFPGTPQSGQWNAPQGQPQQGQQPYPGHGQYPQHYGQQGQPYPGQPGQQHPGQQAPWNAPGYGGFVTGPTTPDGQPLATFWQRVGAYLIDGIIQFLLVLVFAGWLLVRALGPVLDDFRRAIETNDPAAFETINTTGLDYGSLIAFALISAAIQFGYSVLFLSRTGATPGKAVLGISVRLRERPGVPSVGVAARRTSVQTALSLLSNIPVLGNIAGLAALLDLLWPAWDDKKQALHDKFAATNVVKGKQQR
ncbi:hypothetical protein GCM10009867_33470 [Pedococcus aerophilus]|uniref:RDD family protein n=1 Tax=Pedococcus aerophilus TaxID=436356 RepID=A0ABN3UZH8_9MICO